MKTYSKVEKPRWANADKTMITATVAFDDPEIGCVEFTAAATDHETCQHGPQIHKECIGGKHGPIADYVAPYPPPEMTVEQKLARIGLTPADLKKALG